MFCFALSSHTATFSRHGSSPEPLERFGHKVLSSSDIGLWMVHKWVPELNRTISRCRYSAVKTNPSQNTPLVLPIRPLALFLWLLHTGPAVTSGSMTRKRCLVHAFWVLMMRSSNHRSQAKKPTTGQMQRISTKLAPCPRRPGTMYSIQTSARLMVVFQPSTKWGRQLAQALSLLFGMLMTYSLRLRRRRLRLGQPHCSDLLRVLDRHCEPRRE